MGCHIDAAVHLFDQVSSGAKKNKVFNYRAANDTLMSLDWGSIIEARPSELYFYTFSGHFDK